MWRYTTASHLALAGVDVTVIQEWLGRVSINTTCRYKGIPIETKREALRKFYLFEQSWQEAKPEAVDWWQRRFNTPPIVPTQMPPQTVDLAMFSTLRRTL